MKRILITTTAIAALGLAFAASRHGGPVDNVTVRIDQAMHDLDKAHAPIPHAALHARALEILRGRTVAAGEDTNLDPCIVFSKETMAQGPCR